MRQSSGMLPDCQTDLKMDVSHLTPSGPVFLSISAGRLHNPGALPFFRWLTALKISFSVGGKQSTVGSGTASAAALASSSDGGAGGRFKSQSSIPSNGVVFHVSLKPYYHRRDEED